LNKHDQAFTALGDPTRRAIFERLRKKELSVAEIAEGLPVSRPAVSQHLKVLKEAKLISITKAGTRSMCQIDPDGIIAMRSYLNEFWDTALAAFKSAVENQQTHE
jgi:DNA-binding transcriptional ArsR family regulator